MHLEIPQHVEERFIDQAAELAVEHARQSINEKAGEAVKRAINDVITSAIAEQVKSAIASLLTEGWQQTDTWGKPQGEKITLRDLIRERLDKPMGGDYDSRNKGPLLLRVLKDIVEEEVRSHTRAVIDPEIKAFKATLQAKQNAAIIETVRQVAGLPR